MTTSRLLALMWSPDPSVIGGSVALLAAYAAWLRERLSARALLFAAGLATLVLALISPIDGLGDHYLFSVHMVQHMLLILIAPPLLLWGLPPGATRRLMAVPLLDRLERLLGRPRVALPTKILTLWIWHLPVLYDAALASENIHALEHLSFVVTATMFWWPVLTPLRERRLTPQLSMMYLFGAMAGLSVLGIYITFAPTVLYPFYLNPPDPYGALALIRNGWNLSVMADQQLGGVVMWLLGGLFYIVVILIEFGLWFSAPETDVPARPQQRRPALVGRDDAMPSGGRTAMLEDAASAVVGVPNGSVAPPAAVPAAADVRSTAPSRGTTPARGEARPAAAHKALEGAG
ncbi:MAG: cytochrome c oxidase assembly protein [Deinococcales bacterium]